MVHFLIRKWYTFKLVYTEEYKKECSYGNEADFYENDTTWYEGDPDMQWNID